MKRRHFLAAIAFAAAAVNAYAEDRSISIVKIINFSCPVCRASESQDAAILAAARDTGGQFVYAPLPVEEGDYAREKVYYASRKQGMGVEARVRASLYKGAQDMNFPFQDVTQVIEWLKDDIGDKDIDYARLANDARSPDAAQALGRAAVIARQAGAQALPSYVLVQQNAPVATLDASSSGKGTSLLNLREEVINRIGQLTSDKKQ